MSTSTLANLRFATTQIHIMVLNIRFKASVTIIVKLESFILHAFIILHYTESLRANTPTTRFLMTRNEPTVLYIAAIPEHYYKYNHVPFQCLT